jgi:hypothetical protein
MTKQRKSTKTDYAAIDIHELLEQCRQVAVIWSIEDVQELRPDLDGEQAWRVLKECERVHDCSVGFTWDLIDSVADDLFPQAPAEEKAND